MRRGLGDTTRGNLLSTVFLIAGCALMVVAAGMFAWHPLLNLMVEPEVVRRVDGAEVWVIDDDDLTPLYNELEANWDGTLSEFTEDYYVAHDWSDYGAAIASEPDYVEFDDDWYALDGSRYGEVGDDLAEMRSWANAEGRIAFQTCTGEDDGVMVVRYRPVEDAA